MKSRSINSRRILLAMSAAVVVALGFTTNSNPRGNTTMSEPGTPDEAIAEVLAGNQRYVKRMNESQNIVIDRAALAAGQAPFAAVIRCADSRVAPEICFDQQLGRLFVCAVAGNIPTPEIIASLEFGVAVLGTKAIVIMGHSSCGAVDAAIKHRKDTSVLPGSLPMLIDQIVSPCAMKVDPSSKDALDIAIECNANMGVDELVRRSPIIADAVKDGSLKIIAGVQDLKSGKFTVTRK